MHIGIDGSRCFGDRTGTENYSYQIIKNLSRLDAANHYTIFLRPGAQIKAEEWPANFKFHTIPLPRLWTQLGLAWATWTTRLDVLFTPAHTLPLLHRPGLKTVMTVHDLGAEYLPQLHQLKQRLYLGFITKYQFQHASCLIAVSGSTKQDLITKARVKPGNIEVIYEGIDTKMFSAKSDSQSGILKRFDIVKNHYFLFVGTIQPRKNLARLIQAFTIFAQSHPDFKLVLAGGKGWLSDDIYALPAQLGVEPQIVFTGRITDPELITLYQNATALTYPSLFEGFGLPVLEAFAADLPVITSNTSSLPEVAGDAALLVDPEQVEQIAQAMQQILEKPTRAKLLTAAKTQLAKFSWTKAAQETLELLEKVAAK